MKLAEQKLYYKDLVTQVHNLTDLADSMFHELYDNKSWILLEGLSNRSKHVLTGNDINTIGQVGYLIETGRLPRLRGCGGVVTRNIMNTYNKFKGGLDR